MSTKNQRNIEAIYQLATTQEQVDGKGWYPRAHVIAQTIAADYGFNVNTVVGVIAALSPRNKWERNVHDAEALIAAYKAGGEEQALATKVCTFGANKAKAIEICKLYDPTFADVCAILKGPKLQEFFHCIVGCTSEVCIDGHAFCIWNGGRTSLADVPSIGVKLRREIKGDYVVAAHHLKVTPAALQAITWVAYRRIHGIA